MSKNDGGPALAVFSGKCMQGSCGQPVGFNDMGGSPLHVGDIVQTFTVIKRESEDGEWLDMIGDMLTVVVSDAWTSFGDGRHERKDGDESFFVMGIRTVPMGDPGAWRVRLVKSHAHVIDGEHWPQYGFNYGPSPADAMLAERAKDQP